MFDTKGNPVNSSFGFQKIVITYNDEGTLALTRKFYKANGTLLATQHWNGSEWELAQQQFDWKSIVADVNRECPFDLADDDYRLTLLSIQVTGNRECEMRFVVSSHSKSQLSSEQLNDIKEAVRLMTAYIEEGLQHKPYVTSNLYDKNGTALYSVRI